MQSGYLLDLYGTKFRQEILLELLQINAIALDSAGAFAFQTQIIQMLFDPLCHAFRSFSLLSVIFYLPYSLSRKNLHLIAGGTMNQYIDSSAKLGDEVQLGHNCVIMEDVVIGNNCLIGHNVVIHKGSVIGDNVRIDDNVIIGKTPLSSPRSIFKVAQNLEPAHIGSFCQIGANVVIYAQCKIGERNLIADLATIRENVKIGMLNIIGRNVAIENFVEIGDRNKFETNSYITAYSVVEDYCFVAPGVITSNDNYMARDQERFEHFKGITMRSGSRIGANATILPGKVIEPDGMVAAAAVVTKDVPAARIVVGSPAKCFRTVPEPQLLKNNLDTKV